MTNYDIFDFGIGWRRTRNGDTIRVIDMLIKLENNEHYYLGFFTKENIEKLKKVIEEFECQK